MNLAIEKEFDKSFDETTMHLSVSMLNMKSTHLYIASNKWETVTIDIEDSIPERSLMHIPTVADHIQVRLPEKITQTTLRLLTELFPDKAGALRKRYMTDGLIGEVLVGCIVQ